MSGRLKHPHVESFLVLFTRIRDWTDDDPAHIAEMATQDAAFKKLCLDLGFVRYRLREAERSARYLFAKTVGHDFIAAWRVFERRWDRAVSHVELADLFDMAPNITTSPKDRTEDRTVAEAASEAQQEASSLNAAIDFAEFNIEQDYRFDAEFREVVEAGITAWRRLSVDMGFDAEGVFRRRKLIPFVLVPRQISNRHGDNEPLTLFTHLQQAHEAFVYGAPFAALALMRSILEVVLKRHYGAAGEDLAVCISTVGKLPPSVQRAKLHRLRTIANDILHLELGRTQLPRDWEREIVGLLYALRDLIEGAPQGGATSAQGYRPTHR
jgi:hypothetical protein